MGAFINQKNGYGWAVTSTTQYDADENGTYIMVDSTHEAVKTIYVTVDDDQAPIFISKAIRIYNNSGSTATADIVTTGLDINIDIDVDIDTESFTDVIIQGYATANVTITIGSDEVSLSDTYIYKFSEAGV